MSEWIGIKKARSASAKPERRVAESQSAVQWTDCGEWTMGTMGWTMAANAQCACVSRGAVGRAGAPTTYIL